MNIYLKSKSVIVEGCEKEMPEKTRLSFMSANSFSHAIELNAWEKEISSLPHITVLNPPTEWEDGRQVVEGVDYTTGPDANFIHTAYPIIPSSPNQDNGREAEPSKLKCEGNCIEDKSHTWFVGDVFITRFWGVDEVCLIRNIADKYIRFNRLESIRERKGIKKDYCGAEMEIDLFLKIKKTFLHHSEWYYEYNDDIIKIVHEDFPVAKKYNPAPQPSKEVSRTAIQEDDLIIRGLEEGAANWKSEYDNCRAILKELVDLKVMKENLYKGNPDGKEYAERKPKAWEAAKIFLSTYQHH